MSAVIVKTYSAPPVDKDEILRYAGCKSADARVSALLDECLEEVSATLSYAVCYVCLPVHVTGILCDFGVFSVQSSHLAKTLQDCKEVLLFGATVGLALDRAIGKYGKLAPSKALLLQAIGAERIESLCDCFCVDMAKEYGTLTRRFSAGYGDLPLETQKDVFATLSCEKRIGLCLTDSMLASPSKSVTAFVGIREKRSE